MTNSATPLPQNELAMKSALLVIDIQKGLFNKSTPIYQADEFLRNVKFLIKKAHAEGIPVIYIQHSNPSGLVYGSHDWQLHPDIHPINDETLIHKLHGDAFEDTSLHQILQSKNINRLIITGLVTHGCVKSTTIGALDLGYKVILVKDGHSNYSKDAVKLIAKWNQELAKFGAEVQTTKNIIF